MQEMAQMEGKQVLSDVSGKTGTLQDGEGRGGKKQGDHSCGTINESHDCRQLYVAATDSSGIF